MGLAASARDRARSVWLPTAVLRTLVHPVVPRALPGCSFGGSPEYEAEWPPFPGVHESKHGSVSLEAEILQPLHMEQFHSAPEADTAVQQLLPIPQTAEPLPEPPDPKTCSPGEYLEHFIFPVLLPGMAELLHRAKKEKCFERQRTKFIASDFLTEWLYNKNPKRKDESFTEFFSIPFVKDWLKDHPRPPTPLSLRLSEEEASIVIQSFWRGYRVRCDSEIQELRQWQKHLREVKNITKVVEEFWAKQEAKTSRQMGFLHLISSDAAREHLGADTHCWLPHYSFLVHCWERGKQFKAIQCQEDLETSVSQPG
ncbi:IQ domain-containing protein K [Melanerpes formicivorus]|uniref:IQ domain-containing protein K n=1 Tax=Melanerpes formicivorus TaxID=211600 RepID=UPI00358FF343